MSGVAQIGRRFRVGFARWLRELSGKPALWDGEEVREGDPSAPGGEGPTWAIREQSIRARTHYQYTYVPTLQITLEFTPDLGVENTYTIEFGSSPFDVAIGAGDVEADLPLRVQAAFDTSGWALEGWILGPIDNTHFQISAPVASGGLPGYRLGYGWALSAEPIMHGSDVRYTMTIYDFSVLVGYMGGIRGRSAALSAVAEIENAATDEETLHRILVLCGAIPGRIEPAQHQGRSVVGGVVGVADIAQRVFHFDIPRITTRDTAIVSETEIEVQVIPSLPPDP